MINSGLRSYNSRLDIGGFVSTVHSERIATGWSDPSLLFSSFLISSVPLVAVSVPCSLHYPYYESSYHSLCTCIYVCSMSPRGRWNFSVREIYERSESEPSLLVFLASIFASFRPAWSAVPRL